MLVSQFDFLPVPAGTITLGIEASLAEKFTHSYGDIWREFYFRETPQNAVAVEAFDLARYPVTNGQYAQFINADGYHNAEFWTPEGWAWRLNTQRMQPRTWADPNFAGADRPVVGISWFEAMAFTRWATQVSGQEIRLPTESEWEWAARATNTRWLYPWGGVWDAAKLNSGVSERGTTTPVGMFSPAGDGPFGHADLLGQVWEWCSSVFRPYPYANDGREDPYPPERQLLRGGCWGDGKYANRVTTRYHYPAYYADVSTGFRVAAGGAAVALKPRPDHDLVIYGRSSFCPDLVDGKKWLNQWHVPYRQLNIDLDEQVAARLDSWLGTRTIPTYVLAARGQIDPVTPPLDAKSGAFAQRGSRIDAARSRRSGAFRLVAAK